MKTNRRSGFTLVELLVVVAILLILSGLSYAIFGTGKSSDRIRSGARTAQSALLGAKDRALHAKGFRGVRLTRDSSNPNLINGFVYLQPLPVQSVGNINNVAWNDLAIVRPGLTASPPYNDATEILIDTTATLNGLANPWPAIIQQDQAGIWPYTSVQVRIPAGTGSWYQLQRQSASPPYWFTTDSTGVAGQNGKPCLFLQVSYAKAASTNPAVPFASPDASCEIQLGNDLLPFHQPVTLPSGCVIDLNYSNQAAQQLANYPSTFPASNIDIMFSPRGNVTGTVSAFGMLMFAVRDLRDCTPLLDPANKAHGQVLDPADPKVRGDTLILAITPVTGLVATYEADLTDVLNNTTGQLGADGYADDIFAFCRKGQAAGR